MRVYLSYIFVIVTTIFLLSCSSDSKSSTNYSDYELSDVKLSSALVYPNSHQNIELSIYSAQKRSFEDNNDSIVFLFFALEDVSDENNTQWIHSESIGELEKGINTFEYNILIPSDINMSDYKLKINVTNSNEEITDYESESFSILPHNDKPELELVEFYLDLEHSTGDSENDTIVSYEINTTKNLENIINTGLTLYDLNQTLYASATAVIKSHIKSASDIKIAACVELGSTCIDVPISTLSDDNVSSLSFESEDINTSVDSNATPPKPIFLNEINVGSIGENQTKNVDLHLALTPEDLQNFIDELVDNVSLVEGTKINGTIKITISSEDEGSLSAYANTASYPFTITMSPELYAQVISIVNPFSNPPLQTSVPRMATSGSSGSCGLKKLNYEKLYERYKYGENFGAGAYLLGRAYLDNDGAHAKAYASIRVRRLSSTKHRIFRLLVTADAIPASFTETGYDIELSSMGNTFYTHSESLAEIAGLNNPIVTLTTEEEGVISSGGRTNTNVNDNNETNTTSTDTNSTSRVTSRATLLKQKAMKAAKERLNTYKTESTTAVTLVGLDYNYRVGKNIQRKQTIMFSIIPITVTAGAEARIGFDASGGLDGITSMSVMLEPNAYIGAYLQAGAGAGVSCCGKSIEYSAGVGGELWLVSERFTTSVRASLDMVDDGEYIVGLDGNLRENITNYLRTMNGNVYAYATYFGPYNFDEPLSDWKTRTRKKTFANWSGGSYEWELLDKQQTLFSIPIADECEE